MRLLPLLPLLAPRLPSHCKRVFDQPAKTACAVAIRAKTAGLIFSIFLLTTPILALLACTVEEAAERTDGTDRQPTATMEQPAEDATTEPEEDSPTPEATRGGISRQSLPPHPQQVRRMSADQRPSIWGPSQLRRHD